MNWMLCHEGVPFDTKLMEFVPRCAFCCMVDSCYFSPNTMVDTVQEGIIMLSQDDVKGPNIMIYVDPSNASTLMKILAPIFILVSALGVQFKQGIVTLFRRIFHRPGPNILRKP